MRGKTHSDTAAVLAGFQPDTEIPDMVITKRKYGRIHCQPELESITAIIQIYSGDTTLDNDEILCKCATYNTSESEKKYCIVQFRMSEKGHFTNVDLLMLDNRANVTLKENVYKYRARIITASA